jgi:hypothetical protein
MTWCVSTGSYLTHTASFGWSCPRKVIFADISLYAGYLPSFYFAILFLPTHNLAAGTEEQVSELLKRVKELTGMPNPVNLQLNILYFKSFNLCLCFLPSNPCNFKFL